MTPRRAVAEGPGVLAALTGALQNPSALVVGAALATLNNLLLVRHCWERSLCPMFTCQQWLVRRLFADWADSR